MTWDEYIEGLGPREKPLADIYRRISREYGPETLEIGSGWGIFSRAVLEGPDVRLTTIDKLEDRDEFMVRTKGFEDRIHRMIGLSNEILRGLLVDEKRYDLIFVDGSHLYDDVILDLQDSWKLLKSGGVLLVDDVLHPHNFDSDYGVARALWDFMDGALGIGDTIEIVRCGSGGLAVIKKP